jgi:cardiolipin synthase
MWRVFVELWPQLVAVCAFVLSVGVSGHAILWKRDTRAAVGWVALAWLVPIVGAVLYFLLGINRIQRAARALERRRDGGLLEGRSRGVEPEQVEQLIVAAPHLSALARSTDAVASNRLVGGNQLQALDSGQETYAAMLEAIDAATRSIALCSYIFDNDALGKKFVAALEGAVQRGVAVRVLVDAVGARYSRPTIFRALRRSGVICAAFLPTWIPSRYSAINLRNHRKILVVDSRVGFTGGMNIRAEYAAGNAAAPRDMHFRLEGPVVAHLLSCFVEDWVFATRERLDGEPWREHLAGGQPASAGPYLARGIADGPDEDFGVLRSTLLGAISVARHSLRIASPYFLPDSAVTTALGVAARRGVCVEIITPRYSNLPFVGWASMHQMWEVLEPGCHVYLSPPPFDHTKLFIVDDHWALVGSANWDPRSLRLNFEFDVELFAPEKIGALISAFETRRARARRFTSAQLAERSLPVRFRDGIARLFSPYL